MPADNITSFDYTSRLGIKKMPPGYLLIGLESGHFIWERESDEEQSAVHWNKWAIWRSAWHDYVSQADAQPAEVKSLTPDEEEALFVKWANVEYRIDGNTEELNHNHRDVVENRKGWMARAALMNEDQNDE